MIKFLLLFMMPVVAVCQQKKDNTIIAPHVAFDSAVNRLLDMGYKIEKIDKDFKTAQTNVLKYDVVIFIRQKADSLLITGEIWSMDYKIPIEYGWGSKKRWQTLMEFAGFFNNLRFINAPGHSAEDVPIKIKL